MVFMLNEVVDVSREFEDLSNDYFFAASVESFDSKSGRGFVRWERFFKKKRMAFNQISPRFEEASPWEFPPVYGKDLILPFEIAPISGKTFRVRFGICPEAGTDSNSLMIINKDYRSLWDKSWKAYKEGESIKYLNDRLELILSFSPFRLEFRSKSGKSIVRTWHFMDTRCLDNTKPIPLSFVRSVNDLRRTTAVSLTLRPDEKIFGGGESFTRLDKRGQKLVLWCSDAHSVQTGKMYKPVPFFMSSKGYGVFVHTSTPVVFDFGYSYDETTTIFLRDPWVELFFFFGTPREILSEYTALTGRSPLPPLWSFGLWMSRITYRSEEEIRKVAENLRANRVPCDVIHIDTGWFESEWVCDYKFSLSRFPNPKRLFEELKEKGFRVSIWQMPYFVPSNELYRVALKRGYAISTSDGSLPTEDAIIDFSNPEAVEWYKSILRNLLEMGVNAIKADFGEAVPLHGQCFSGKNGFSEHNLYPLRYQKAVAEVTKEVTGENIIWARSAWAGSQRYPVHWGGDAESTFPGMAATLRGGMSLGLCGFSFWSHDVGGFTRPPTENEELYKKWLALGIFTSHCRCHGVPPREPWEFRPEAVEWFRRIVEVRYSLLPYIYTQSALAARSGFPVVRPLFFEYPEDRTSWFVEDEYLFGSDLLVAPLFEEGTLARYVYLPGGTSWIDYQTRKTYQGGRWHFVEAGDIPIIVLVREGTILPRVPVSQSTAWIDWKKLEVVVYCTKESPFGEGYIYFPWEEMFHSLKFSPDLGLISDLPNGIKLQVIKI